MMSLKRSLLNGIVPKLIFSVPVAIFSLRSEGFWESPKMQIFVIGLLVLVFFGEALIWVIKNNINNKRH